MKNYMKTELKKELLQMVKEGKGYITISNFIKDFSLDFAWVSEINEDSTSWKLTVRTGHNFKYYHSANFEW